MLAPLSSLRNSNSSSFRSPPPQARTQKNKATNYHLGTLKAKTAKLKSELLNGPGGKSSGSKDAGRGFDVSKSGDTRVGLVGACSTVPLLVNSTLITLAPTGFPSVGKSTLLTTLTGTASEAAAYEFTTLTCIPGTMNYRGARIQVLDLPGIIEGAADGKGRGRQVISTARTCNMILVVLDSAKPVTHKKLIEVRNCVELTRRAGNTTVALKLQLCH